MNKTKRFVALLLVMTSLMSNVPLLGSATSASAATNPILTGALYDHATGTVNVTGTGFEVGEYIIRVVNTKLTEMVSLEDITVLEGGTVTRGLNVGSILTPHSSGLLNTYANTDDYVVRVTKLDGSPVTSTPLTNNRFVSFDMNEFPGVTPPVMSVAYGQKVARPSVSPVQYGFSFMGWYNNANTSAPKQDDVDSEWLFNFDKVTKNVDLYAKRVQNSMTDSNAVITNLTYKTATGGAYAVGVDVNGLLVNKMYVARVVDDSNKSWFAVEDLIPTLDGNYTFDIVTGEISDFSDIYVKINDLDGNLITKRQLMPTGTYTVNFDFNYPVDHKNDANVLPSPQAGEWGKKLTPPGEFSLEGWVLLGWYKTAEPDIAVDRSWGFNSGDRAEIAGNFTLYAKWIQGVAYNANFPVGAGAETGRVPRDMTIYPLDGTVSATVKGNIGTEPENIPLSKVGYEFAGWTLDREGEGSIYDANSTILMDSTKMFYAKWNKTGHVIEYKANGGITAAAPVDNTVYALDGSQSAVVFGNANGMIKPGFLFGGWTETAENGGIVYGPGYVPQILMDKERTLYTRWLDASEAGIANIRTVTYVNQWPEMPAGTGNAPTATYHLSGENAYVLGNPGGLQKAGWAFIGWQHDADNNGKIEGDEAKVTYGPRDNQEKSIEMENMSVSMYAKWVRGLENIYVHPDEDEKKYTGFVDADLKPIVFDLGKFNYDAVSASDSFTAKITLFEDMEIKEVTVDNGFLYSGSTESDLLVNLDGTKGDTLITITVVPTVGAAEEMVYTIRVKNNDVNLTNMEFDYERVTSNDAYVDDPGLSYFVGYVNKDETASLGGMAVPYESAILALEPQSETAKIEVSVDGVAVTEGIVVGQYGITQVPITFNKTGDTKVEIKLTAEDGVSTRTYIYEIASQDSFLTDFKVDEATVVGFEKKKYTGYSAATSKSTAKIDWTTEDPNAKVEVKVYDFGNTEVMGAYDAASHAVTLQEGRTTVELIVRAKDYSRQSRDGLGEYSESGTDEVYTKKYSVSIGSNDASPSDVSLDGGTVPLIQTGGSAGFDGSVKEYRAFVHATTTQNMLAVSLTSGMEKFGNVEVSSNTAGGVTKISKQAYTLTHGVPGTKNIVTVVVTAQDGIAKNTYIVEIVKSYFNAGTGTAEDPYKITTATELNAIRNDLGAHYIMADTVSFGADDDFNGDLPGNFEPIGTKDAPFTGSLTVTPDVAASMVSNIDHIAIEAHVEGTAYVGLFGYVKGANIDGLRFSGTSVIKAVGNTANNTIYAGMVAGYTEGGSIKNIESRGAFTVYGGSEVYAGAITGKADVSAEIYNVKNYALVLVEMSYEAQNAINAAKGKGVVNVGGLTGLLENSQITCSENIGRIDVKGYQENVIGGVSGKTKGATLINRTANTAYIYVSGTKGTASPRSNVGGLVGFNGFETNAPNIATISNSYNAGGLSVGSGSPGGTVGLTAGGLVGSSTGQNKILTSYNAGSVNTFGIATSPYVGTIMGMTTSGSATAAREQFTAVYYLDYTGTKAVAQPNSTTAYNTYATAKTAEWMAAEGTPAAGGYPVSWEFGTVWQFESGADATGYKYPVLMPATRYAGDTNITTLAALSLSNTRTLTGTQPSIQFAADTHEYNIKNAGIYKDGLLTFTPSFPGAKIEVLVDVDGDGLHDDENYVNGKVIFAKDYETVIKVKVSSEELDEQNQPKFEEYTVTVRSQNNSINASEFVLGDANLITTAGADTAFDKDTLAYRAIVNDCYELINKLPLAFALEGNGAIVDVVASGIGANYESTAPTSTAPNAQAGIVTLASKGSTTLTLTVTPPDMNASNKKTYRIIITGNNNSLNALAFGCVAGCTFHSGTDDCYASELDGGFMSDKTAYAATPLNVNVKKAQLTYSLYDDLYSKVEVTTEGANSSYNSGTRVVTLSDSGTTLVRIRITSQDGKIRDYEILVSDNSALLQTLKVGDSTYVNSFGVPVQFSPVRLEYTAKLPSEVEMGSTVPVSWTFLGSAASASVTKVSTGGSFVPAADDMGGTLTLATKGETVITVSVLGKAENGKDPSKNDYTVTIHSNDNSLDTLALVAGGINLIQNFETDVLTYDNIRVESGTEKADISWLMNDPSVKGVDVKIDTQPGITGASFEPRGDGTGGVVTLATGLNTITTAVMAQDGTVRNYIAYVMRPSDNKDLASVNILNTIGDVSNANVAWNTFEKDQTSYTIFAKTSATANGILNIVKDHISSTVTVTVDGVNKDNTTPVSGSGASYTSSQNPSLPGTMSVTGNIVFATKGNTRITIDVTAQNGEHKEYKIIIVNNKTTLSGMSFTNVVSQLKPISIPFAFNKATRNYQNQKVETSADQGGVISFSPDNTQGGRVEASITGGGPVSSGGVVAFAQTGTTQVQVRVYAEDGRYGDYTINVSRPSTVKSLESMSITDIQLGDPFSSTKFDYYGKLINKAATEAQFNFAITDRMSEAHAYYKDADGVEHPIALTQSELRYSGVLPIQTTGIREFIINVIAEDSSERAYNFRVRRSDYVAQLEDIKVDNKSISESFPAESKFDKTVYDYTKEPYIPIAVTGVNFSVEATKPENSNIFYEVSVEGITYPNGVVPIDLGGSKVVKVIAWSDDAPNEKYTYQMIVSRFSDRAELTDMILEGADFTSPASFTPGVTGYVAKTISADTESVKLIYTKPADVKSVRVSTVEGDAVITNPNASPTIIKLAPGETTTVILTVVAQTGAVVPYSIVINRASKTTISAIGVSKPNPIVVYIGEDRTLELTGGDLVNPVNPGDTVTYTIKKETESDMYATATFEGGLTTITATTPPEKLILNGVKIPENELSGKQVFTIRAEAAGEGEKTVVTETRVEAQIYNNNIDAIRMKTSPTTKVYREGEKIDLTGATIELHNPADGTVWKDNIELKGNADVKTEIVQAEGAKQEDIKTMWTVGTHTILVTYKGCVTSFNIDVQQKSLTAASMKTMPSKAEYYEGEKISTANGEIMLTFNNKPEVGAPGAPDDLTVSTEGYQTVVTSLGSAEITNAGKDGVMEWQGNRTGTAPRVQTQTLNAKYTQIKNDGSKFDKTATFNVDVKRNVVTGIEIKEMPTKLHYIEGQLLELTGLKAIAHYEYEPADYVHKEIAVPGPQSTITGFNNPDVSPNTNLGAQTVTLTYTTGENDAGPFTDTFEVNLRAKVPTGLSLDTSAATKLTYTEGEPLDVTGILATITYDNGSTSNALISNAEASGFNNRPSPAFGTQTITVTKAVRGVTISATYDVTVNERAVTHLEFVNPIKDTYIEGQTLDITAANKIRVFYNDGTNSGQNDTDIIIKDALASGVLTHSAFDDRPIFAAGVTSVEQVITFSYTYDKVTGDDQVVTIPKKITVNQKRVNAISVVQNPLYPGILTLKEGHVLVADDFKVKVGETMVDLFTLKITYDNGDIEQNYSIAGGINSGDITISGYDSAPGGKYIVFTYKNDAALSAGMQAEVKAREVIGIKLNPETYTYATIEGKDLNFGAGADGELGGSFAGDDELIGATLTVSYDNSTTGEVAITRNMISGFNAFPIFPLEGEVVQEITVRYGQNGMYQAKFNVTVGQKSILGNGGIQILTQPKLTYIEGEKFDISGGEFQINYTNDTHSEPIALDDSKISIDGFDGNNTVNGGDTSSYDLHVYYTVGDEKYTTIGEVNEGTGEVTPIPAFTATVDKRIVNGIEMCTDETHPHGAQPEQIVGVQGIPIDWSKIFIMVDYENSPDVCVPAVENPDDPWDVIDKNLTGTGTFGTFSGDLVYKLYPGSLHEQYRSIPISVEITPQQIASIAVNKLPTKTEYIEGQSAEYTGGEILVTYNNTDTQVVSMTAAGVVMTGFNSSPTFQEGATESMQNISITYTTENNGTGTLADAMSFKVTKKTTVANDATITAHFTTESYLEGATGIAGAGDNNDTGARIKVWFDNGLADDFIEVVVTPDMVTGFNGKPDETAYLKGHSTHNVQIVYNGITLDYPNPIEIRQKQVAKVDALTPPTKTVYRIGEKLDVTGMTARLTYDNGDTETVDVPLELVTGFDSSTLPVNIADRLIQLTVVYKSVYDQEDAMRLPDATATTLPSEITCQWAGMKLGSEEVVHPTDCKQLHVEIAPKRIEKFNVLGFTDPEMTTAIPSDIRNIANPGTGTTDPYTRWTFRADTTYYFKLDIDLSAPDVEVTLIDWKYLLPSGNSTFYTVTPVDADSDGIFEAAVIKTKTVAEIKANGANVPNNGKESIGFISDQLTTPAHVYAYVEYYDSIAKQKLNNPDTTEDGFTTVHPEPNINNFGVVNFVPRGIKDGIVQDVDGKKLADKFVAYWGDSVQLYMGYVFDYRFTLEQAKPTVSWQFNGPNIYNTTLSSSGLLEVKASNSTGSMPIVGNITYIDEFGNTVSLKGVQAKPGQKINVQLLSKSMSDLVIKAKAANPADPDIVLDENYRVEANANGNCVDYTYEFGGLPEGTQIFSTTWEVIEDVEHTGASMLLLGDGKMGRLNMGIVEKASNIGIRLTIKYDAGGERVSTISVDQPVQILPPSQEQFGLYIAGPSVVDLNAEEKAKFTKALLPGNGDITGAKWSISDATEGANDISNTVSIDNNGVLTTGNLDGLINVCAEVTSGGKVYTTEKIVKIVGNVDYEFVIYKNNDFSKKATEFDVGDTVHVQFKKSAGAYLSTNAVVGYTTGIVYDSKYLKNTTFSETNKNWAKGGSTVERYDANADELKKQMRDYAAAGDVFRRSEGYKVSNYDEAYKKQITYYGEDKDVQYEVPRRIVLESRWDDTVPYSNDPVTGMFHGNAGEVRMGMYTFEVMEAPQGGELSFGIYAGVGEFEYYNSTIVDGYTPGSVQNLSYRSIAGFPENPDPDSANGVLQLVSSNKEASQRANTILPVKIGIEKPLAKKVANLSGLTATDGILAPVFETDKHSYTVSIDENNTSVGIVATAQELDGATVKFYSDSAMTKEIESALVDNTYTATVDTSTILAGGRHYIYIKSELTHEGLSKTYSVAVHRAGEVPPIEVDETITLAANNGNSVSALLEGIEQDAVMDGAEKKARIARHNAYLLNVGDDLDHDLSAMFVYKARRFRFMDPMITVTTGKGVDVTANATITRGIYNADGELVYDLPDFDPSQPEALLDLNDQVDFGEYILRYTVTYGSGDKVITDTVDRPFYVITLSGDANLDGYITYVDFNLVNEFMSTPGEMPTAKLDAKLHKLMNTVRINDTNADGDINAIDLQLIQGDIDGRGCIWQKYAKFNYFVLSLGDTEAVSAEEYFATH